MTEPIYNRSDDDIRAAFERFAKRYRYSIDRDRDLDLLYASPTTQSAWMAWLGAMDTIRREAKEIKAEKDGSE